MLRETGPIRGGDAFGTLPIPLIELRTLLWRQTLDTFQHFAEPLLDSTVLDIDDLPIVKFVLHFPLL